MYGLRWNVETDLRVLKRTVRLHHIHARSIDMMEKELLLAVLAYNLVRTVMCLAARKAGLSPRHLSFTAVYMLIETHLPKLLGARSSTAWRREMDRIVEHAAAYKLPKRKKTRSYPRAVWGTGDASPHESMEKTKWHWPPRPPCLIFNGVPFSKHSELRFLPPRCRDAAVADWRQLPSEDRESS